MTGPEEGNPSRRPKARLYALPSAGVSHDTVDALEQLLAYARAGTLIGFAMVCLDARRRTTTHTAGECHRDPTYTRGMVLQLDAMLADIITERSSQPTDFGDLNG